MRLVYGVVGVFEIQGKRRLEKRIGEGNRQVRCYSKGSWYVKEEVGVWVKDDKDW